jgi:Fic family protein
MVYIHKKKIGDVTYYTLRISVRKGDKVIARDLCTLGTDLSKIDIDELSKKYAKEIRKSYKTINLFLSSEKYLEEARKIKHKKFDVISKEQLIEVEATKLHFDKFLKLEKQTQLDIYENFLIRFAVNSTSIEGNTITMSEAIRLFKEEIVPKDRTTREVFDLTNTKKVFFDLLEKKPEITMDLIIDVHDSLLENIDVRKGIRNHDIHILGQPFKPSPARYVADDLKILLQWYDSVKSKLHPFVLAVLFHHKLETIHPFSDGNGRTGRMIMNLILLKHKYPVFVIERKDRKNYLDAMNKADKATNKSIKNIDSNYDTLVGFMSKQYAESYWDVFLF